MPSAADVKELLDQADQAEDSYGATGDPAALETALRAREAILAHPAVRLTGEQRAILLNGIGSASLWRYWATGSEDDLSRAVQSFDEAVDSSPPGYPELPGILTNLGNALRDRHMRFGELQDLERMMRCLERAVDETPAGSSSLAARLSNLGNGLRDRYLRLGDAQDLEQAIDLYARSVRDTPPDSPDLPMRLANLGTGLRDRHELRGARDDLDRALDAQARALEKTPPDSPYLPTFLTGLALVLASRFRLRGDVRDLDRCIEAQEQAVRGAHPQSPNLPLWLSNLGSFLLERYDTAGGAETLERAIETLERAVGIGPPGSPMLSVALGNLGRALLSRYQLTGSREDLERAGVPGTALAPPPPAAGADADSGWAVSPDVRGDGGDREEPLGQLERALEDEAKPTPARIGVLAILGTTLLQRYLETGAAADLDGGIRAYRYVLQKIPPDSPHWPGAASALGAALHRRYLGTGDLSELEEAVDASSQGVSATPPDSPELPGRLVNLGNGLWEKHRRTGALGDLEGALEAYRDALERTRRGAPARPARLYNLAAALRARFGEVGDRDDLERAIDVYREAVTATRPGSPDFPGMLSGLGAGHWDRYEHGGGRSDLDAALDAYERAVAATPAGSPDLPGRLSNLGNAVSARHCILGEPGDLEKGHASYREACRLGTALDPAACLDAARNWGGWAASRQSWEEAADAYGYGLEAMGRLFRTQLLRRHKEAWLAEAQGLPGRAAFALAEAGDAPAAAVAVEQGRALLLSEALERDRSDLERLREAGRGDLVERYQEAAGRSSMLARAELEPSGASKAAPTLAESLRQAQEELEAVIASIRELEGYEGFLQPADFADVVQGAGAEPLAYLAAAEAGGLALVVRPREQTVEHLPLPALSAEALREHATAFRDAYAARSRDRRGWLFVLDEVTAWLWQAAMGPLLEALGPLPHVYVVPAGLLGLLPLHAAWTPDATTPTGRRYALDGPLLTFSPNARALTAARRAARRVEPRSIVAVGEPRPQPPGVEPLPHASLEAEAAAAGFADRLVLTHERATAREVLRALPAAPVLHLSCHGRAELELPLHSHLLMARGVRLTLAELLGAQLTARLTVLSACETAVPGEALPDEVVSLPTGLIQAGAGGVVASLWSVPEEATMMLMVRFYQLWRGDEPREPPWALREAQRWLRDTTNGDKARDLAAYLPQAGHPLASQAAEALWRDLVLEPPGNRDYDHPYHWAAFAYVGA